MKFSRKLWEEGKEKWQRRLCGVIWFFFFFLMCLNNVQWLIEGSDNSLCTYIQFTTFFKKSNLRNVQRLFEVLIYYILQLDTIYKIFQKNVNACCERDKLWKWWSFEQKCLMCNLC
jgi:hypothetical protein